MKTQKELKANILSFANLHPDGFTLDSADAREVQEGFAVSVEATQNSFGVKGLERVIRYARANKIEAVGGWYNSEDGRFYYDATRIFRDFNAAAAFAVENHQLAFFDLKACREYRITAAGEVVAA